MANWFKLCDNILVDFLKSLKRCLINVWNHFKTKHKHYCLVLQRKNSRVIIYDRWQTGSNYVTISRWIAYTPYLSFTLCIAFLSSAMIPLECFVDDDDPPFFLPLSPFILGDGAAVTLRT